MHVRKRRNSAGNEIGRGCATAEGDGQKGARFTQSHLTPLPQKLQKALKTRPGR